MLHSHFMNVAHLLAEQGEGISGNNPSVGCVIVSQSRIVSYGYTYYHGVPHAEFFALSRLNQFEKECDMYVTLEPCCHYGKTFPCVNRIIQDKRIVRVFIGVLDDNFLVAGRSVFLLRQANIPVFIFKKAF